MLWGMVLLILLLQLAFTYWPPLQELFATTGLELEAWAWCLLAALGVCLLVELEKTLHRWRQVSPGAQQQA